MKLEKHLLIIEANRAALSDVILTARNLEKINDNLSMEDRDFTVCELEKCHNVTRKVILYGTCPDVICLDTEPCTLRDYENCTLCD
uniref:Uncharacterized protein n=1 Tax=Romanomermis culicivorax TaxID=13658 RepID=A0A915JY27_ROMCU